MRTVQTVVTWCGVVTIIHDPTPADVTACTLSPEGWRIIRRRAA